MTARQNQEIPTEQWQKFSQLILKKTGLLFADNKRQELIRGLMTVLEKSNCKSLDELYLRLTANREANLFDELIGQLTVGETYFYRDEHQFELLKREIFPVLIKEAQKSQKLKIWSAGCATGEEPYTVAILLRELLPYFNNWDIFILATDINKKALAKAKKGIYNLWSFRNIPPNWPKLYFEQLDEKTFQIKETIKSFVTFSYLNLKDNLYPSLFNQTVDLDLIICRNVAIYWNQTVTNDVFRRFYEALRPGGYLLLGASDPTPNGLNFLLKVNNGTFIYQKEKKKPFATATTTTNAEKTKKFSPYLDLENSYIETKAAPEARKKEPKHSLKVHRYETAAQHDSRQEAAPEHKKEQKRTDVKNMLTSIQELMEHNKLKEAETLLQQFLVKNKTVGEAYFYLGLISEAQGKVETAGDYLKRAVYLNPDFLEAHFILALVYKKLGLRKQAALHFKRLLKLISLKPDLTQVVPGTNGLTYAHLKEVAELELVKGAEYVS